MKKSLRLMMLSFTAMLCGTAFAQTEVTLNFDEDYATLFPTIPGVSSSANKETGAEASSDGDFTGVTTSAAVQGVTVTVAPAEDAKTPSRIWASSPRLRMYSGTFTVSGKDITKIEFSAGSNFNLSTGTGSLNGKTWSGQADEVVFDVAKNTQLKSIVVTLGGQPGGGDDPETPPINLTGEGTLASPFTAADATAMASALEQGTTTNDSYYIKGKVSSITYTFDVEHGTATFYISEDGSETDQFLIYAAYYLGNRSWKDGDTQIAVGDDVIVCGQLTNYKGTPETASKKNYIYSLNGVTDGGSGGDDPDPQPQVKTANVAEALAIISALEDGKKTGDEYVVKGYVVGAPEFQRKDDGSLYGNVNFAMADEKGGSATLTVFRAKSFDNEPFTEESISILKEGDLVEVQGLLQKFVKDGETTPELATCHLVTINGLSGDAAVSSITVDRHEGVIYNLAGQRVAKAVKGLYIQDGRKYIVK